MNTNLVAHKHWRQQDMALADDTWRKKTLPAAFLQLSVPVQTQSNDLHGA